MKKLLLPIDGSNRSMKAAEQVKRLYNKDDVKIILLTVRSDCQFVNSKEELEEITEQSFGIFENAEKILEGYQLERRIDFGHIGNMILKYIQDENVTAVIMTRSTREGHFQKLGSVTSYVLKYARCLIVIVPEIEQYICQNNSGTIHLSGQFCKGADTCEIPYKAGKCIYEFRVLKGKIRLNHMAYNPDGGTWTQEPGNHQKCHYNIASGEKVRIELFVGVSYGYEDQLSLVNPSFFDPAVVQYEYLQE